MSEILANDEPLGRSVKVGIVAFLCDDRQSMDTMKSVVAFDKIIVLFSLNQGLFRVLADHRLDNTPLGYHMLQLHLFVECRERILAVVALQSLG